MSSNGRTATDQMRPSVSRASSPGLPVIRKATNARTATTAIPGQNQPVREACEPAVSTALTLGISRYPMLRTDSRYFGSSPVSRRLCRNMLTRCLRVSSPTTTSPHTSVSSCSIGTTAGACRARHTKRSKDSLGSWIFSSPRQTLRCRGSTSRSPIWIGASCRCLVGIG